MKAFESYLEELRAAGQLRTLAPMPHRGTEVAINDQWLINLSSNDYLGLASHCPNTESIEKGDKAKERIPCPNHLHSSSSYSLSSSSSRLLTGSFPIYHELEEAMEQSFGRPVLLFNSGYHANIGILPALATRRSLILSDRLIHASIIDGIRLSDAKHLRYRHNDYAHLEALLEQHAAQHDRIFIVTESIFSMDGDVADLRRLVALKQRYDNAWLYVDEAHGIGVRGDNGLGVAEETETIGEIDLLVGTFGKALASMGAYVVCHEVVRKVLINRARSLIFATALPPLCIATTLHWWRLLPTLRGERTHLKALADRLRQALRARGLQTDGDSHIVPWTIGENDDALAVATTLRRHGFNASAVRPPTVPPHTARLRFSLTAALTIDQLDRLIALLPSGNRDVATTPPLESANSNAPQP